MCSRSSADLGISISAQGGGCPGFGSRDALVQARTSTDDLACWAAASPSLSAAAPVLPSPSPKARCIIAADTSCGVTCATADRVWGTTGGAACVAWEVFADVCVAVEDTAGGGEGRVATGGGVVGATRIDQAHPLE